MNDLTLLNDGRQYCSNTARMPVKLLTTQHKDQLAAAIVDRLGIDCAVIDVHSFLDGEVSVDVKEDVRGHDVYVLHTHYGDPNKWYVEAILIADMLKRSGVESMSLVAPYLVYARQDVPDGSHHASYASPVICKGLSVYDHICVTDLHAQQTQGFFQTPVTCLSIVDAISTHIMSADISNLVLVSPDFGGSKRVQAIHNQVNCGIAVIEKNHIEHGVESVKVLGQIAGKDCVLIDDIMVSGQSLQAASHLLHNQGALSVRVYVTHLLHHDIEAWQKEAKVDAVYTTDSTNASQHIEISLAPQIAAFIRQQQGGNNDS